MLATLPDECKQLLWGFLDAQELCRMSCVARTIDQGVVLAPLWQQRAVAMIQRELVRLQTQTPPVACALQRQNATRRLDLGGGGNVDAAMEGDSLVEAAASRLIGASFWKDWYRDFYLSVRGFEAARTAFDAAQSELQELKKQRTDLRELVQALKSKSHNDKQLRRMQMNCVRWLNRTVRRTAATNQARTAHHAALSKTELHDQLQSVENTLQLQSKSLFSLRSQFQKSQNRLTAQVARGRRVLTDLDLDLNLAS